MATREDKTEVLNGMLEDMKNNTPITQIAEGGLARSILEIFNERIDTTYNYVDDLSPMAYVSTATGSYLDRIGELVDCERLSNELDENYRYRITQQVHVAAKSNKDALVLKCLEVEGINDVILTPYTYGIGSFTAHIISEDLDTPDELVLQAQAILNENQAAGVRGIAEKPELVSIDIVVRLVLMAGVTSQEGRSISYDIQTKIEDYVKELGMGNSINSMDIYQIADSAKVAEVSVESVKINSKEIDTLQPEYSIKWNERCYPREIKIIA